MAVLSYDLFDRVLKSHYSQINENKISIFKNMPIFKKVSTQSLKILYNICQLIELPINVTIYKETERTDAIYFLLEGEVEIKIKSYYEEDSLL